LSVAFAEENSDAAISTGSDDEVKFLIIVHIADDNIAWSASN
jgi:hypothetical protein